MKIKKLEIRNALGIKELSLKIDKVTMITGGSEQGKSSILDAIEKGLYNTSKRSQFIRQGEHEALIHLEIEPDITVTRKVRDGKSDSVKVTQAGSVVSRPEAFLKTLTNNYAFNPVEFLNLRDKDQTDLLLGLIPLTLTEEMVTSWFNEMPPTGCAGHGLTALKTIESYYYNLRTENNRTLNTTQTQLDALSLKLPPNYDPAEWENISLQDKYNQIESIQKTKNAMNDCRNVIDNTKLAMEKTVDFYEGKIKGNASDRDAEIERLKRANVESKSTIELRISELKQQITELEADLRGMDSTVDSKIAIVTERYSNASTKLVEEKRAAVESINNNEIQAHTFLDAAVDLPDVDKLKEEAAHIEQMKGYARYYHDVQETAVKLKTLQDTTEFLDSKIATARRKPAELLSAMKMPVTGLGVNDEFQITVDTLPINGLSTSRKIKLSLEIARATAGKLKLICVDQFEALDVDRRAEFLQEIETDDFHYFITQVTNGALKIDTGEKSVDNEMSA